MKCLLKLTTYGDYRFCKDKLDTRKNRIPTYKVIQCLEEHKVKHCINCKDYPINKL